MDPDSDPDPAIFVIDLQNAKNKKLIYKKFFLPNTCTSLFKDKNQKSHKSVGIEFFLTVLFLRDDRRIRIQKAQNHTYGSVTLDLMLVTPSGWSLL